MLPFVSCLCPTFNRCPDHQWLIEECIESFRRQDYPLDRRELLILNDCPAQTLICRVPGVRVVNVTERAASLGEKFNEMVRLAQGELLCSWEDDDLSRPKRISQGVFKLGCRTTDGGWFCQADYWKPPQVIFLHGDNPPVFQHSVGVRHHASIFTRAAWLKVGGYPQVSGNQDAAMDGLLRQQCNVAPEGDLGPADWQYIYRWGVSPNHLSGIAPHDEFYRRIGEAPVAAGQYELIPHYRRDYEGEIAKELAKL